MSDGSKLGTAAKVAIAAVSLGAVAAAGYAFLGGKRKDGASKDDSKADVPPSPGALQASQTTQQSPDAALPPTTPGQAKSALTCLLSAEPTVTEALVEPDDEGGDFDLVALQAAPEFVVWRQQWGDRFWERPEWRTVYGVRYRRFDDSFLRASPEYDVWKHRYGERFWERPEWRTRFGSEFAGRRGALRPHSTPRTTLRPTQSATPKPSTPAATKPTSKQPVAPVSSVTPAASVAMKVAPKSTAQPAATSAPTVTPIAATAMKVIGTSPIAQSPAVKAAAVKVPL